MNTPETADGHDSKKLLDIYFDTIVHLAGFTPGGGRFYLDRILGHVNFAGKRVLDIGGGRGVYSYYAACSGARDVVCLEPQGDGSSEDMIEIFRSTGERLPQLDNIRLQVNTIQDYDPGDEKFDVILMHASINHLDEDACIRLHKDATARDTYRGIFGQIASLCNDGAQLIACDVSRLNFFGLIGTTNPMAPDIEWHKHQPPGVWAELLVEVGFANPSTHWRIRRRKNAVIRFLSSNRVASYFQASNFCLKMELSGARRNGNT